MIGRVTLICAKCKTDIEFNFEQGKIEIKPCSTCISKANDEFYKAVNRVMKEWGKSQ